MIKLDRAEKPTYLTDKKVIELTQEYIKDGKSVWNNNNIKTPLLNSSNNKCAYCECLLTKESNYMEVEHFEDKSHNPGKVVLWENLLPSCKKCNGKKGTHDVLNEPIVNPYIENPKDHFVMRLYRMRGKTDRGINSIDVYGLNHSARLVMSRFEIGEKISELINTSWDRVNTYVNNKNTRSKNKLIGIVEGMLEECQPSSAYSASTATMLLTDKKFIELVDKLKFEKIWTEDLGSLHNLASNLVIECA